jgi:hypothetical protein
MLQILFLVHGNITSSKKLGQRALFVETWQQTTARDQTTGL